MALTTIYIISPHLMFGSGLESLLSRETHLSIIGKEKSIEQALEPIQTLQPGVVILDSDEISRNDFSSVVRIFNVNPNGRIIGLSLRSNRTYVYHIRESTVQQPEDLLHFITGNGRS